MKRITCAQMGGPCHAVFEGETSGEIASLANDHITELAKTDDAHARAYEKMAAIAADPVRHQEWKEGFSRLWEKTPAVGTKGA
jgi:hypothetical protein